MGVGGVGIKETHNRPHSEQTWHRLCHSEPGRDPRVYVCRIEEFKMHVENTFSGRWLF